MSEISSDAVDAAVRPSHTMERTGHDGNGMIGYSCSSCGRIAHYDFVQGHVIGSAVIEECFS